MRNENFISIVLLAAGSSSRMAPYHKLLVKAGSHTILRHSADAICQLQPKENLIVLGHRAEEMTRELDGLSVKIITNNDYEKGMHSSIRAAVKAIDERSKAMLICLADQPFDLKSRIEKMLDVDSIDCKDLIRSVCEGKPGHPVLIGRDYFDEILAHADDDRGCHYLFNRHPHREVYQEASASWDLDSMSDFLQHSNALKSL